MNDQVANNVLDTVSLSEFEMHSQVASLPEPSIAAITLVQLSLGSNLG
jgi:hypothetical protein